MLRYRTKVILLTLGVVLGYGSAIAHFARGHDHPGSCRGDWNTMTK